MDPSAGGRVSQLEQHWAPSTYTLPVSPLLGHDITTKMPGLGMSLTTEMFPSASAPNLKFYVTYILSENLSATAYSKKG